jgi:hypothetical protein
MPNPAPLDEDSAETLLRASVRGGSDDDPLALFLRDVRAVVNQPAPAPTPALALVLRSGFSTTPIEPLVTAGSRRHKEKQHTIMKSTGILRGVTGKVLAVSTVLLVGIGTAAAAGALPGTGQHSVAAVQASASTSGLSKAGNASAKVGASLPVVGHVSAGTQVPHGTSTTSTGSAGAGANVSAAGVNASAGVGTGGLNLGGLAGHSGSGAGGTISGITSSLSACLSGLANTATGQPLLALGTVIPTVVTCVKNVIASLPVPTAVSSCVSSLLNSLGTLPMVGSGAGVVTLKGCVPIDLSTCIGAALNTSGGLLSGSIGLFNLPSVILTCATSIVSGVLNLVTSLLGQVTGTVGGVTGVTGLPGVSASASLGRTSKTHFTRH